MHENNKTYYYNFNCSNNIEGLLNNNTLGDKGFFFITKCQPSYQYIKKEDTKLLVLNQYNIKNKNDLNNFKDVEYLLLINSPFINFKLIKDELPRLKLVLFDRSNKKNHINIWKKLCSRYDLKYLYVYKKYKFI